MSEESPIGGITKYWQIIVGILVAAITIGGFLEREKDTEKDVATLRDTYEERFKVIEEKQEKRGKIIEEIDLRVDKIEQYRAFEEGYNQALKDLKVNK